MLDGSYLRPFLKCRKLFIDRFKVSENFDISGRLGIDRKKYFCKIWTLKMTIYLFAAKSPCTNVHCKKKVSLKKSDISKCLGNGGKKYFSKNVVLKNKMYIFAAKLAWRSKVIEKNRLLWKNDISERLGNGRKPYFCKNSTFNMTIL